MDKGRASPTFNVRQTLSNLGCRSRRRARKYEVDISEDIQCHKKVKLVNTNQESLHAPRILPKYNDLAAKEDHKKSNVNAEHVTDVLEMDDGVGLHDQVEGPFIVEKCYFNAGKSATQGNGSVIIPDDFFGSDLPLWNNKLARRNRRPRRVSATMVSGALNDEGYDDNGNRNEVYGVTSGQQSVSNAASSIQSGSGTDGIELIDDVFGSEMPMRINQATIEDRQSNKPVLFQAPVKESNDQDATEVNDASNDIESN